VQTSQSQWAALQDEPLFPGRTIGTDTLVAGHRLCCLIRFGSAHSPKPQVPWTSGFLESSAARLSIVRVCLYPTAPGRRPRGKKSASGRWWSTPPCETGPTDPRALTNSRLARRSSSPPKLRTISGRLYFSGCDLVLFIPDGRVGLVLATYQGHAGNPDAELSSRKACRRIWRLVRLGEAFAMRDLGCRCTDLVAGQGGQVHPTAAEAFAAKTGLPAGSC